MTHQRLEVSLQIKSGRLLLSKLIKILRFQRNNVLLDLQFIKESRKNLFTKILGRTVVFNTTFEQHISVLE